MVVPSRKNRMMHKIIQDQERDKEKLKGNVKEKEVSSEEHKKRIEMSKKIGLIKDIKK